MTTRAGPELETLIGQEAFIRLAEAFGGTRLYVPAKIDPQHEIAQAIGLPAAEALSARLAPDVIKVPLAREQLALRYRELGDSNPVIARKLRITESGVEKLFARNRRRSAGSQLSLSFSNDRHSAGD